MEWAAPGNFISCKKLDQALSKWVKEMKCDVMITADVAMQKAEELSSKLGYERKPSIAWLYKWRDRENINFARPISSPENSLRIPSCKNESLMRRVNRKKARLELHTEEIITNSIKEDELVRENVPSQCLPNKSGARRKERTFITLLQKVEILQRLKNGERRRDLTKEYNLSHKSMFQIVTDEKRILEVAADGQNLKMKRIRGGIFKNSEAELNAWVRQKMENGESLTRAQIKNRAKEIAERLNIDFKASAGWLENWKARMNLHFTEDKKLKQILPNYTTTGDKSENSQSNSLYVQQDAEMAKSVIKEEHIENDYDNIQTTDEFIYNVIDEIDVKPESLTEQFYLPTVRYDSKTSQTCKDTQKQMQPKEGNRLKQGELDVKTSVGTLPDILHREKIQSTPETLHDEILHWINRYNISPIAASELMNIIMKKMSPIQSIKSKNDLI